MELTGGRFLVGPVNSCLECRLTCVKGTARCKHPSCCPVLYPEKKNSLLRRSAVPIQQIDLCKVL